MAMLLVTASTGAMGSILTKLASMLTDKYKALKHVRGDIETLKKELEFMHAFLLTMENVEEPNEQDRLRVRDVRELSYDIEDSIDKFIVQVDTEPNTKTQGFFKTTTDKCKNLITDIKTRHQIAKEVKDMMNQVVETSRRYNRYRNNNETLPEKRNTMVDAVLLAFKDASDVVGIDGPRNELINLLNNHGEDESTHQLKVVSLVGFGGLGKTTLAYQVYRNLGANFDCMAFVSISRSPDMTQILTSILRQINKTVEAGSAKENIMIQIRDFLQDKRYFILIDDIWDEKTWECLQCAFPKNESGSRILITTRKMDVARSCSLNHDDLIYPIKPLSVVDSKKLFFKRIFGCEEECPPNLKGAADDILKKCGGLPLAIIAISSLLATRQTNDQWERVQRSIGFAFGKSSDVDRMRAILSLSYFELPSHLKSCFLYLALFPEDYEIDRRRLVHRWIAEGFILDEGGTGKDLVKLGDDYFHDLVNRSLVQPLKIGYDGKAEGCRVHDTILDFIIHKSTEENLCTVLRDDSRLPHLQDTKVRRLSLWNNDSKTELMNTSHLRSLGFFRSMSLWPEILSGMEFRYLRALDLRGCSQVNDFLKLNIGKLHQLRYLNVAYTDIQELPTHIGDLQYLGTLDATWTPMLYDLPETITQLKQLARLFVDYATLPDGIGNLKNLQELGTISSSSCSLKSLQGLGELINLRDLTILFDTTKMKDKPCHMEKLMSSLCKLEKSNLSNLVLEFKLKTDDGLDGDTFFPVLNSIRSVTLEGPEKCNIIKWLVSLVNLQYLDIHVSDVEQQDFELIGSIPELRYLKLMTNPFVDEIRPPLTICRGFHRLHKFCLVSRVDGLKVEAGATLQLKDLELWINPLLFQLRLGGFDFGMQHLSSLASVHLHIDYEFVRDADIEACKGAFKRMVEEHPNRPTLEFETW